MENSKVKKVAQKNEVKNPTVSELQKKIKELENKLSQEPKSFEEKLSFYQEKQELIRKKVKLDGNKEVFTKHLEALQPMAEANDFDNKDYSLRLYGDEYGRDEVIKIKNPVVIAELLEFLIQKIDDKRNELKALIEA